MRAALEIRQTELDFAVETSQTQQCRVQRAGSAGCHEHLDVAAAVEAIELGDDLEYGALHLDVGVVVLARGTRTTNRIYLVEEDELSVKETFSPRLTTNCAIRRGLDCQ